MNTDLLEQFKSYEHNWDSYGAIPPTPLALDRARVVLQAMDDIGVSPTRVDPCPDGSLDVVFAKGLLYADIECCALEKDTSFACFVDYGDRKFLSIFTMPTDANGALDQDFIGALAIWMLDFINDPTAKLIW